LPCAEWQNNDKLTKVPSKFSPSLGENDGKFISTWNFGDTQLLELMAEELETQEEDSQVQ
jgi:hypothetical protein